LRALSCTSDLVAIPDAACRINELLNTLSTDGVTAGRDDGWIKVSIETDWTLEILGSHKPNHHIRLQVLSTA
jgi:hypothetical protein